MKVYVVGSSTNYANWLKPELVKTIKEADIVLFTGGEDVCPKLYNEPIGARTFYNEERDNFEKEIFKEALELDKHMLGICRGAQLLCVLSGGRLVQHQENPNSYHPIEIQGVYRKSGFGAVEISSTHHQSQFPYDMPQKYYRIIATANESRFHLDGKEKEMLFTPNSEVEIAYYPITKCMAIQGHPEYMSRTKSPDTFAFLDLLIENFLKDIKI